MPLPGKYLVLLIVVLALVILGAWGAASLMGPRITKLETKVEEATDDATGRGLEAKGSTFITDKQAELDAASAAQEKTADALDKQAQADPASRATLGAGALDRLRAGDRELCKSGRVAC